MTVRDLAHALLITLALVLGTITAAAADGPLPAKIREVDHLRLKTSEYELALEQERALRARAELDRATRAAERLVAERAALVERVRREYRMGPEDRYDENTLEIVRASKKDASK